MLEPSVQVSANWSGDVHVPALVVGAGACGLSAALHLHARGIETLVLERDARPAGSTSLSSGFVPAAGTLAQQAMGEDDSPDLFAQDIQGKAHGQAAPHLVQAYTQAIAPAMDFLQQQHGFAWQVLDGFLYPGHSRKRMHTLPERRGEALVQRLDNCVRGCDVALLTDAQAHRLVVDEQQRVLGVCVRRPDGSEERIGCDAMLLACNGYGASVSWLQRFVPNMVSATYAGHVGNDGTAVTWGEALGVPLCDMGAYQGHGSWAVPHGSLVTWALMMEGGVQINRLGQRFHNESLGYSEAAVQVLAQPDGLAWCVFDAEILQTARGFPDFVDAESAGAVLHAADVQQLAQRLGCPADHLAATLQAVQPTIADTWGRQFKRALQPPYAAVKVTGALFHTQGGLDVDATCRVRGATGKPLPNCWAAGGAARGVSGPDVSGYLSGNGLLSALAGGYLAAHAMADALE